MNAPFRGMIVECRWRRVDVPGHETARFEEHADGWRIAGDVVVEDIRLRYGIECDRAWCTRVASIEAPGLRIELVADGRGHWSRDGSPLPALDGALDVDLGFTPATNTLPIRRLALAIGETRPVRGAWLRFPELRLELLDQTYTREGADAYRYRALVDGEPFAARLATDRFGCVVEYEGLWSAEW